MYYSYVRMYVKSRKIFVDDFLVLEAENAATVPTQPPTKSKHEGTTKVLIRACTYMHVCRYIRGYISM